MQKNLPLVSIGLPIFNRPEGLIRSLECLVNQTYQNIEIIIADNCSTNVEVEKIAREYLAKDSRISYYRHDSNKGWGYNTNFVIEKAKAEYFMRATDDDWWDFTFIEKIMKKMLENPSSSLGFSNFIEVDIYGDKSKYHINNHLPLLESFTNINKVENVINYINQFEGFGKSCLYFSIFKIDNLKSDYVKKIIGDEILTGDLLINLYCLLNGQVEIVSEVLLHVCFGNEKQYDVHEIKTKKTDFILFTFDVKNFKSVKEKWLNYFLTQFQIISNSNLNLFDKFRVKIKIGRRILIFHYDLVTVNLRIKRIKLFEKIQRKHFLE